MKKKFLKITTAVKNLSYGLLRQARQYSLPETCTGQKQQSSQNYLEHHKEVSVNVINVCMLVCSYVYR